MCSICRGVFPTWLKVFFLIFFLNSRLFVLIKWQSSRPQTKDVNYLLEINSNIYIYFFFFFFLSSFPRSHTYHTHLHTPKIGFSKISRLPKKQNTKLDEEKWLSPLSLVFTAKEQIFKKQDSVSQTTTEIKEIRSLVPATETPRGRDPVRGSGWWCGPYKALPPLEGWHILTAMGNLHFHATDRVHMVKGTWPEPYTSKGVMFLLESMYRAGQSEWNRERSGLWYKQPHLHDILETTQPFLKDILI